ncbi:MAG TPA: alpha/beta fold hydrolase [Steroidobacter sp.]|uniref:alpha/beta fold hydrolase n=1 Tax=Steroidobacter sp. TaxID=1978227 RepID=UPI002EDAA4C7
MSVGTTQRITRHFATVGGRRQVHYRRCGEGSPVILLHQSPASSREYLGLIAEIAALGRTVIAPDTPGNGLSDPLPDRDEPRMEEFASALSEFMTELAIESAPVYGFHTGGVCALALGLLHPERVTVGVTDGYVHLGDLQREEILANYFTPLGCDWSGSHLTWAWARMREQVIFFPWYRKDTASRIEMDLPPPAVLHDWLMELMRAGDAYRKAYRAAFTFDCAQAVRTTRANTVITTTRTDVLNPCMDALPPVPANVLTRRPETDAQSRALTIQTLLAHPSPQPNVANRSAKPMPGRIWADYLQVNGVSIYCRRSTEGEGRPIVMVHPSVESSLSMDRYMQPLIGRRPLLAVDLPGNGESDSGGTEISVETQARMLGQAIRAAGYDEVELFGHQGGGYVAVELACQEPGLVKHVAAPTMAILDDARRQEYIELYAPAIELEEYGAHLIKAWNMLRDQELFEPWYKRTREHIRRDSEPDIAPEVIHRRVMDLFKCIDIYQAVHLAHFTYPVLEKLKQVRCPVLIGSQAADALKGAAPIGGSVTIRPTSDVTELSRSMMDFFEGKDVASAKRQA